ncbi:MAG: hypothetical protein AAGF47_08050 [Planctomycetota bacterium]
MTGPAVKLARGRGGVHRCAVCDGRRLDELLRYRRAMASRRSSRDSLTDEVVWLIAERAVIAGRGGGSCRLMPGEVMDLCDEVLSLRRRVADLEAVL